MNKNMNASRVICENSRHDLKSLVSEPSEN